MFTIRLIIILFISFGLSVTMAEDVRNPVEHWSTYPKMKFPKGEKGEAIKRGEYLVMASDCIACHSTDAEHPFAGGNGVRPEIPLLGYQVPLGTFYSPNITPDAETGIGKWTREDFHNAIRHGVAPDGSQYYPALPYLWFTKFSDQDISDMYDYFMAIPAVKRENKPHDIPFFMKWREIMLGWKLLFFYPFDGPYRPDATRSEEWNRGAFLVEGPAHCGMCHTPITMFGSPQLDKSYTGSIIDGYAAPNITGTSLKKVSVDELIRVFKYDEVPGGGEVKGPMKEVNHDSLMYLKDSDLRAISTYLKTTVDSEPLVISGSGDAKGQAIYNKHCMNCHASGAGGAPKFGDANDWAAIQAQPIEQTHDHAIKGFHGMPAMGLCGECVDDDIKATVDYMLKAVSASTAGPKRPLGPAPKEYTLADGKALYDKVCASCHNDGSLNAPKIGDEKAWKKRLDMQGFFGLLNGVVHPEGYKPLPNDCVPKGTCDECSDGLLIAAVKYILQKSVKQNDYKLW